MAKDESLPESVLSDEQVEYICRNWSTHWDTCRDEPRPLDIFHWPCDPNVCKDVFGESMVVPKNRDMPMEPWLNEAKAYITVLVSKYPFQLRAEMARPMWHRFLWYWAETGSRQKALRHI